MGSSHETHLTACHHTRHPGGSSTVHQLMRWCVKRPDRRFAVGPAAWAARSRNSWPPRARMVDVPSTLSAQARLLATGGDRKTDAADALHVAQLALFRHDLRPVVQCQRPRTCRGLRSLPAAP